MLNITLANSIWSGNGHRQDILSRVEMVINKQKHTRVVLENTLSHSPTLTLSHAHSLTLSLSHTLTLAHSHTLTLSWSESGHRQAEEEDESHGRPTRPT